jgi:aldehyde dehydrogenase (NAD+)
MDILVEESQELKAKELFQQLRERSITMRGEPIEKRKRRLLKIKHWILGNLDQLNEAAAADLNKPGLEFTSVEVLFVLNEIKTAIKCLDRWTRAASVKAPLEMLGTHGEIRFEPMGLCLIVSPWNYPFCLCVGPLVSALAAGNAVIVKPSELAPQMSSAITRMVRETCDPSEVASLEGGQEASRILFGLPFDHIFFTGSLEVGKIVMKSAAEHLSSVTLELGGKSPCIVTRTAAIDEAARRIVVSKFVNAGQTCIAPDYVLVDKGVEEAFISKVVFHTQACFPDRSQFAGIVSIRHFERLEALLDDGMRRGAMAVYSGTNDANALFFHPCVLRNVPADARMMDEEIFGPILPIVTFSQLEEALEVINGKPKPLGLYVFSRNEKEKKQILAQTSSGGVCVNDCAIQFLHCGLPFGGVNQSGFGRAHGFAGFRAFSNERAVLNQRHGLTTVSFLYPPYTTKKKNLLVKFMKLFYR